MICQTIHEIAEGWTVYTPLGEGTALLYLAPSYLNNGVVVVKLSKTGELKHFDTNDIRMQGSPTYGEPLVPKLPEEWNTKKDK